MSGSNNALQFLGVGNLLEREYRNAPAYQWARELVRNGIEAEALNIEFGVEWQAVMATGIYRLQYADDGVGMSRIQLREYMSTLGKGGKIVGGPHDNYAMGCRLTLLPWNPFGVVVISQVQGEEPYMVKLMYDQDAGPDGAGEYVLEEVEWHDGANVTRSTVYEPYPDADLKIDWSDTIPKLIRDAGHGTTFILLGRSETDDTFEGDSERGESIRALSRKYFNTRFWALPDAVTLQCLEFMKPEVRSEWPTSPDDISEKYRNRGVKGAKEVVEYVTRGTGSTVMASGTRDLDDGTKAHWWLRQVEPVQTGGVGTNSGFIAVRYRDELYGHAYANREDGDSKQGANVYRQCGIGNDLVRKRVFVIFEPPEYDEDTGRAGVAPSTGRADLYWMGAGLSSRSIKPGDWAEAFSYDMPEEIQEALNAAYEETKVKDEERGERMKRVMDRFSKRWRVTRAKVSTGTTDTTTEPTTATPTASRQRPDVPVPPRPRKPRKRVIVRPPNTGEANLGKPGTGSTPAKITRVSLGLPECRWVNAEDIADEGMLAAWQPPSAAYENGLIEIDQTHPVIVGQVQYWQAQYPKAVGPEVMDIVKSSYEMVAIAKVSHIHALSTDGVLSEEQRDDMLQNPSLTASLVGLLGEDAIITPRLGGLGAKRKREDSDTNEDSGAAVAAHA